MVSGWFGARTVERDLPSNIREMGDTSEFAYSHPSICQQRQDHEIVSAPSDHVFPQSDLNETPRVLLLWVRQ